MPVDEKEKLGLPLRGGSGLKFELTNLIREAEGLPLRGGSGLKLGLLYKVCYRFAVSLCEEGVD